MADDKRVQIERKIKQMVFPKESERVRMAAGKARNAIMSTITRVIGGGSGLGE